jgi:hypothetical protein
MKIELPIEGVLALNDTLSTAAPKGRAELHKHAQLFQNLIAQCREFTNAAKTEFRWKPGSIEVDDVDGIWYLAGLVNKRINAGVNGQLSIGYAMLLAEMDKKP